MDADEPVSTTLSRRQWAYLRDLVAVEGALDAESRHLVSDPEDADGLCQALDEAAGGVSP